MNKRINAIILNILASMLLITQDTFSRRWWRRWPCGGGGGRVAAADVDGWRAVTWAAERHGSVGSWRCAQELVVDGRANLERSYCSSLVGGAGTGT